MTSTIRMTREAWLEAAIEALRPRFAEVGMDLPERMHVSVGFGYGASRENGIILGQCWARSTSEDGANHLFISPQIGETSVVLGVLMHELIHAADDCQSGHKGAFAEAATRLGLEGKMTEALPSVALQAELICLAETIGEYPHGVLNPVAQRVPVDPTGAPAPTPGRVHSGPTKQSTRMLKVVCAQDGYTVRTTAKWLEIGYPACPCGAVMQDG
ncbi:hypothetical protein [Actinophytocola sediminis]